MAEKDNTFEPIPYVVLQKDRFRYSFRYDNALKNYDVTNEESLCHGRTLTSKKMSVKDAMKHILILKEQGFLEFQNIRDVSWYATIENNTPYTEKWDEKDGFLVPIDSHSAGIVRINGYVCKRVDEWKQNGHSYVLGNSVTNKDFYYAKVDDFYDINVLEFDKRPARTEVENAYLNYEASMAIDEHKCHSKHLNQELVRMTKNNKPDEMIRLIREGADVNYKDKFGVPVLQWATNHANSHTIELLVEHGADVNAQDKEGKTKLMLMASHGDIDVVSYLLEHGANACLKDRDGRDALSFAKKV